jgi:hypothetical protein
MPTDTYGNGGFNNFWFGLYGGPANQLFGSQQSVTIPVAGSTTQTVYTLTDNTFGFAGVPEFFVTFNGTAGATNGYYVGASNTKDYNLNCGTTGCDATPNAGYWFVDASGAQSLQIQAWTIPSGFGRRRLRSIRLTGGTAPSLPVSP